MKQTSLILLTTLALALPPLSAQDIGAGAPNREPRTVNREPSAAAGGGSIEGRVSNLSDQKYLTNARLVIEGTILEEFTDEYGYYRFNNLGAGTYKVRASFTGLESRIIEITIAAPGQRVVQDFEIGSTEIMDILRGQGTGPRTKDDDIVLLEKFSVVSSRETAANIIATNEQRFALNTKSVIETDAFGETNAGNAAEFLKYMPGVAVDYDGIEANAVSVRGFGPAFTNVTMDGAVTANAAGDGSSRGFAFNQVSINDFSRIEVHKLPLPSHSANALGGSINLISKSAFESKTTRLRLKALYSFNSKNLAFLEKTPGPLYDTTYKILPGMEFDLTMPITRNFGVVVTGAMVNQYTEQRQSRTQWNFQQNALDRLDLQKDPYLQAYQIQSRPRQIERNSLGVRFDWRVNRNHVFQLSYRWNHDERTDGKRNMNWDISENAVLDTSGVRATREWGWTEDWGYYVLSPENYYNSSGAVRGERFIKQNVGGTKRTTIANAVNLKYLYKGNNWEADAMANFSTSKAWERSGDEGYFYNSTTQMIDRMAGRIGIFGINGSGAPASIKAFAMRSNEEIDAGFRFGEEMDVFDLSNYHVNSVELRKNDTKETRKQIQLNIKRTLGGLPFLAMVQFGGDYQMQDRDKTQPRQLMTMLPTGSDYPQYQDLVAAGYRDAINYVDESYSTVNPGFGIPTFDWLSPRKLYQLYQTNPTWFTPTGDQARDSIRDTLRSSKKISEAITSFYMQFDGRFLDNRLTIAGGVRWEMTDDRGLGCLEPTEGETAADIEANWIERGSYSQRTYNDFYPSLHTTWSITQNMQFRAAYARTIGRPDFEDIIPNTRINDNLAETGDGDPYTSRINAVNPSLRPFVADNFDISLEYYPRRGGAITLGGYYKRIDGLIVETVSRATMEDLQMLNIGAEYLRVPLVMKTNLESMTTVYGLEAQYRTPLTFLGDWGRAFEVMFNFTMTRLQGDYRANFDGTIEQAGNFSITYRPSTRLRLGLNCNYRGLQKRGAQTGDRFQRDAEGSTDAVPFEGFYEYVLPAIRMEANLEYSFIKNFTFFITAKNINNPTVEREIYNPVSATYAPWSKGYMSETYGAQFTFGIKGSF